MGQYEYSPEIKVILDHVLEDDGTPHGGIDHPGETVAEYLESIAGDGTEIRTLAELNEALVASGIMPVESKRPSIRAQLAEAQQNREKEQVQRLIDVLDNSMEAYKTEWSKASDDYLIADAHFICAVKDAYEYLTETHRFTPEEVDWMLRMKNPLHAVAVKWRERQSDLSDLPFALGDAIKDKRAEYKHEMEAR